MSRFGIVMLAVLMVLSMSKASVSGDDEDKSTCRIEFGEMEKVVSVSPGSTDLKISDNHIVWMDGDKYKYLKSYNNTSKKVVQLLSKAFDEFTDWYSIYFYQDWFGYSVLSMNLGIYCEIGKLDGTEMKKISGDFPLSSMNFIRDGKVYIHLMSFEEERSGTYTYDLESGKTEKFTERRIGSELFECGDSLISFFGLGTKFINILDFNGKLIKTVEFDEEVEIHEVSKRGYVLYSVEGEDRKACNRDWFCYDVDNSETWHIEGFAENYDRLYVVEYLNIPSRDIFTVYLGNSTGDDRQIEYDLWVINPDKKETFMLEDAHDHGVYDKFVVYSTSSDHAYGHIKLFDSESNKTHTLTDKKMDYYCPVMNNESILFFKEDHTKWSVQSIPCTMHDCDEEEPEKGNTESESEGEGEVTDREFEFGEIESLTKVKARSMSPVCVNGYIVWMDGMFNGSLKSRNLETGGEVTLIEDLDNGLFSSPGTGTFFDGEYYCSKVWQVNSMEEYIQLGKLDGSMKKRIAEEAVFGYIVLMHEGKVFLSLTFSDEDQNGLYVYDIESESLESFSSITGIGRLIPVAEGYICYSFGEEAVSLLDEDGNLIRILFNEGDVWDVNERYIFYRTKTETDDGAITDWYCYDMDNDSTWEIDQMRGSYNIFVGNEASFTKDIFTIHLGEKLKGATGWKLWVVDPETQKAYLVKEWVAGPNDYIPQPGVSVFDDTAVYATGETDSWNIEMFDADTAEKITVTNIKGNYFHPFIAEDRILYFNVKGNKWTLESIPYSMKETEQ